jgi:predicted glutamine amidotransferase
MCGIVGYIAKYPKAMERSREKFLIEGLVMDTLRGWDSTGLIWVDEEFDVGTMRNTQPGPQFVRNRKFIETDTNGWACIGHNRAATRGSVKVGNAHPFRFGPVALVHNGTLRDWRTGLPFNNSKIEVDSAMIAYNLSKVAPEDANEIFKCVDGDFTFVWTDQRDKSINFVRNNGRPLHLAESRSKNLMYFMSEAGMLRSLTERMKDSSAKIDDVYSLETFKHLKFKQGSLVPEVTSIDPFVRKPLYSGSQHSAANRRYEKLWDDAVKKGSQSGQKTGSGSTSDNVVPLHGDHMVMRNGKYQSPNKMLMEACQELYQLNSHNHVRFVPDEYIPWDGDKGMVRGMFTHPGWGDTEWEGVVYEFPSAWLNKDRFSEEWTVSPIGLTMAWVGKSSQSTMPAVMLSVRKFSWVEDNSFQTDFDDEAPPWTAEKEEIKDNIEEQESIEAMVDDHLGTEMFFGPNDKLIWREQIEGLLEYGCCYCTCNLTAEDHEDILWVGMHDSQPLCLECQNIFTDPAFDDDVIEGEIVH